MLKEGYVSLYVMPNAIEGKCMICNIQPSIVPNKYGTIVGNVTNTHSGKG